VKGIGNKGASKLIAQYGNLEGVYAHLDEVPVRQRELLEAGQQQAFESRELATIVRDAPVQLDLDETRYTGGGPRPTDRALSGARILQLDRPRAGHIAPSGFTCAGSQFTTRRPGNSSACLAKRVDAGPGDDGRVFPAGTVSGSVVEGLHDLKSGTVTRVVRDQVGLDALVHELSSVENFAFDTETTSTDPLRAKLVGLSFATVPREGWYVPVGHAEGEQLNLDLVLKQLRPLLSDPHRGKIGHNLKYDYAVMAGYGIVVQGLAFDTMVAAYLTNPTGRNLSLTALALQKLRIEMIPIEALTR